MSHLLPMIGKRFGRYLVIGRAANKGALLHWLCRCDCGQEKIVYGYHLRRGAIVSCGCHARDVARSVKYKHGLCASKTYSCWCSMLRRCDWPKNKFFGRYGGRGITVCDRWKDFTNFVADMGECPDGMSIDRVNNDGNYEPSNCRWATIVQQANNRSTNVVIMFQGEKFTMKQLSDKCGVPYSALVWRIKIGKWPIDRAVKP